MAISKYDKHVVKMQELAKKAGIELSYSEAIEFLILTLEGVRDAAEEIKEMAKREVAE